MRTQKLKQIFLTNKKKNVFEEKKLYVRFGECSFFLCQKTHYLTLSLMYKVTKMERTLALSSTVVVFLT